MPLYRTGSATFSATPSQAGTPRPTANSPTNHTTPTSLINEQRSPLGSARPPSCHGSVRSGTALLSRSASLGTRAPSAQGSIRPSVSSAASVMPISPSVRSNSGSIGASSHSLAPSVTSARPFYTLTTAVPQSIDDRPPTIDPVFSSPASLLRTRSVASRAPSVVSSHLTRLTGARSTGTPILAPGSPRDAQPIPGPVSRNPHPAELHLARRNANDVGQLILMIIRYVKALREQAKESKARRKKKKEGAAADKKENDIESILEDKARLERELGELAEGSIRGGSVAGGPPQISVNVVKVVPKVNETACIWEKEGYAGWKVRRVPVTIRHGML
ncbi:hypothetical protein CROQUDRAFT_381479 [Cronartium quercuum f. sp. fusiforme G11]|uniref:Uncharacterized protein n=1 Tax=Cronartium quercuum f. sp. fusiforme G11 TaxID=708437 RepID=A0A9P6NA11_9BASI|nr:hypothetical protein CROQUDRAFT_381479 [Cronartium quercuum f. sp. fusiforme G11]